MLPALFISHGSPMLALEPGDAGAFLKALGPRIDARLGRPKLVLVLSAHTLARSPVLLGAAQHHAVHDFGGFPDPLYRMRYDAPGAPAWAPRVAARLADAGLTVQTLDRGGLDHGIWVPLRYLWPDASVPVLPLSFSPYDAPSTLLALGRALAPLASEGVLVIGSGSLTHNLGLMAGAGWPPAVAAPETPEVAAFRCWVHARSTAGDWAALTDYRRQAPHAALMHPTDEHWLPFYAAAGAGGPDAPAVRLHGSVSYGHLAMDTYAFGPQADALQDPASNPA